MYLIIEKHPNLDELLQIRSAYQPKILFRVSLSATSELLPPCRLAVFIHAEYVVQSAWILFSLWMYVCMLVL